MSQIIPIGICKLKDINEGKVESSVKIIEKRKAKIQLQENFFKPEVNSINCENIVLDKQTNCTESLSQKLKFEISELKTKTEDAAFCLELTKWKFYKANLLKEFDNQTNKDVGMQTFKQEQFVSQKTHTDNFDDAPRVYCLKNDNSLKKLRENAEELMQEIGKKKEAKEIEKVDCNLHMDIKIFERRNAALTVRYQRQVQEIESRYRQTLTELNSLQKLFVEKSTLSTAV